MKRHPNDRDLDSGFGHKEGEPSQNDESDLKLFAWTLWCSSIVARQLAVGTTCG